MHNFIKRNQKKMLAVFGILLMITFVISGNARGPSCRGPYVLGKVGGAPLTDNDVQQAQHDIYLLLRGSFVPLYKLDEGRAAAVFKEHPNVYAMLQIEARKQGIVITEAQAQTAVKEAKLENIEAAEQDELLAAVGRFMLVQTAYDNAAATVKVSRPLLDYNLATGYQSLSLNIVELTADQYRAAAGRPASDEIAKQYERFADREPEPSSVVTTQPATPGYKVPDRVKIQYVDLPRDRILAAKLDQLTREQIYQLDLVGYEYWSDPKNAAEFTVTPPPATAPTTSQPSTQPSTVASTLPATLPTSLPATVPSTEPTVKPFATVAPDLRRRLLLGQIPSTAPAVDALRKSLEEETISLRNDLAAELRKGYDAYVAASAAAPATGPTTGPTAEPTSGFQSVQFLDHVAEAFEARHKVRPLVSSLSNEWMTEQDLATLPGIGEARHGMGSFAAYAVRSIDTSPPPAPTTAPTTSPSTLPVTRPLAHRNSLRLFEPSDILDGVNDNSYIFRVTAYDPEHKPTLADAEPAIVRDLTTAKGYDMAVARAASLMNDAKVAALSSASGGLTAVARASGLNVIKAGPMQDIRSFDLEGERARWGRSRCS